jgi:asparagine synthase (glutamine-hydrolysing)
MRQVAGSGLEYVDDGFPPGTTPPDRDIRDIEVATQRIDAYMFARARATTESFPGRPVVLLSGGIDSIATAISLQLIGEDPLCITVVKADCSASDQSRSRMVARHLRLDHSLVRLDPMEASQLLARVALSLGSEDRWELAAAVVVQAAFDHLKTIGWTAEPVYCGGGADILLAGGKQLKSSPGSAAEMRELKQLIWTDVRTNFTYHRQIPEFYSLLLGVDSRSLIHFFQTVAAWEATNRFAPEVLFRSCQGEEGARSDKSALREWALRTGLPAHLAWSKKEPTQLSSGVFETIEPAVVTGRANTSESTNEPIET